MKFKRFNGIDEISDCGRFALLATHNQGFTLWMPCHNLGDNRFQHLTKDAMRYDDAIEWMWLHVQAFEED